MRRTFPTWRYALNRFSSAIDANLMNIGVLVIAACPFVCMMVTASRGHVGVGGEFILAVAMMVAGATLCWRGTLRGQGLEPPRPVRRFTRVDGDRISVDRERLAELLVYMADLEDWLGEEEDGDVR